MKQEENRPMINMGDGNSGNTNNISFMGLTLGQMVNTGIVIGTLLITSGMQWNRYGNALEKIDKLEVTVSQQSTKVQMLEMKVAQHDKAFESVVDTNKELKATVSEFSKTVNKLNETVSWMGGKLSK